MNELISYFQYYFSIFHFVSMNNTSTGYSTPTITESSCTTLIATRIPRPVTRMQEGITVRLLNQILE